MIAPMSLQDLASVTAGQAYGEALCERLSTDSRDVGPGVVYLGLKGERFDGSDFAESALQAGAVAAVVSRESGVAEREGFVGIAVDDARLALAQIACRNREAFDGPVIGITGSCGKTSVKDMLRAIFTQAGSVLATEGNFNNEVGVPLTLLRLSAADDYAVVEMGARQRGDIAYLCDIAKPDIAVLINARTAHIEIFGSEENIARGKAEIFQGLSASGTAVVNADEPWFGLWQEILADADTWGGAVPQQIHFGFAEHADVRAEGLSSNGEGSEFSLCYQQQTCRVQLSLLGRHMVSNALAAAAAALAAGLSLELIAKGLASLASTPGRLAPVAAGELILIDDSYNANPDAMRAAIDVLMELPAPRVLVLGDMAELGDTAPAAHREVAAYAAEQGIDAVYCCGEYTADYRAGNAAVNVCASKPALSETLVADLQGSESVLVKGSRSAAMETVVEALALHFEGLSKQGSLH